MAETVFTKVQVANTNTRVGFAKSIWWTSVDMPKTNQPNKKKNPNKQTISM